MFRIIFGLAKSNRLVTPRMLLISVFVPQRRIFGRPPSIRQPVIGVTILKADELKDISRVVDSTLLDRVGNEVGPGRSKGHIVKWQVSFDKVEHYHYKLPHYRGGFVKELFANALAVYLMPEASADLKIVEHEVDADKGISQYGLISRCPNECYNDPNLEQWALSYENDETAFQHGPKRMGVSLAFKQFIGDSDAKAANFVLVKNDSHCISIDHEYAFDKAASFIHNSYTAIYRLKDFDDERDRDIPLQSKPDLLEKIEPVFTHAIQADLDNGSVLAFYERIVAMTDEDINGLFNGIAELIMPEEKTLLIADLKVRQAATRQFLVKHGDELRQMQAGKQKMEEAVMAAMQDVVRSMRRAF